MPTSTASLFDRERRLQQQGEASRKQTPDGKNSSGNSNKGKWALAQEIAGKANKQGEVDVRFLVLGSVVFWLTSPATAQYIDYNAVNVTSNLQVMMREGLASRANSRSALSRPTASTPTRPRAGGDYRVRPASTGVATTAFPYRSTSALRRAAADAFIERTAKSSPVAARAIAAQLAQQDFDRIYAGIVAPFGYRADDAADALAAYTLLGWLIANGAPDPSRADAAAVRAQVAAGLANDRRFSDPRTRAELAEEMKLLFVTLHAGWQSARREGNLKPYADGVATMFKRFTGNDLRAMRLTERGFVRG